MIKILIPFFPFLFFVLATALASGEQTTGVSPNLAADWINSQGVGAILLSFFLFLYYRMFQMAENTQKQSIQSFERNTAALNELSNKISEIKQSLKELQSSRHP